MLDGYHLDITRLLEKPPLPSPLLPRRGGRSIREESDNTPLKWGINESAAQAETLVRWWLYEEARVGIFEWILFAEASLTQHHSRWHFIQE